MVSAQGDESSWGQLFLLVWAAAGPQSVGAVPLLGAMRWRLVHLTLPNIDGQPGDTVWVCASAERCVSRSESAVDYALQLPSALCVALQKPPTAKAGSRYLGLALLLKASPEFRRGQ